MPNNSLASGSRDQAITAGQRITPSKNHGSERAGRIDPAAFEPTERPDEDWLGAMRCMFVYGPALSLALYGALAAAAWFLAS